MRRVNWSARSPAVWIAAAGCCWLIWNMVVSRISEPAGNWSQQRRDGDPSQPVPHSERFVTYRSTVCDCVRNRSENIQLASKHSQFNWCGPESTLRGVEQKVVAFSIFGKADEKGSRYYSFLRDNAVTVNQVLPGWIMRLHHNLEKGTTEHGLLCQVYCESPWMDLCDINALWRQFAKRSKAGKPDWRPVTGEQISNLNKRMWRFIPLLDPLVDVLITRDLDASIIEREIVAVRQWLESNFTFHVMRDHHGHTARILAGMFGVKTFQRRDLIEGLTRVMVEYGQNQKYETDQQLLAKIFWPVVKHDVMAHDSYNCKEKWNAFPTFPFPTRRVNRTFVSANLEGRWVDPTKCPAACRPPEHPDWEYC